MQVAERTPRPRMVALEIGPEQATTVAELLSGAGFDEVRIHTDLAGRDRVVEARTVGGP